MNNWYKILKYQSINKESAIKDKIKYFLASMAIMSPLFILLAKEALQTSDKVILQEIKQNPEKIKSQVINYYQNNPEKIQGKVEKTYITDENNKVYDESSDKYKKLDLIDLNDKNHYVPQKESSWIDIDKIATIESSNNPNAVNKRTGARGLTQILNSKIWDQIAKESGKNWKWEDAFDGEKNKDLGEYYINYMIPRYLKSFGIPDTLNNRLASYNWGVGNLNKIYKKYGNNYINYLPEETKNYISKYKAL